MRQRRLPLAVYPVAVGLMIMSGQALGQTSPFQPTYEEGTVRRGQDYRSFHPIAPSALYCQQACLTEAQCRAWSYEPPTVRGDKQPMCWLKGSVPPAAKAQGYASGVVRPDVNEAAAALPGDKTNAPAPDGAVKAIFEKYNLLGVFAQDCSKPAKAVDNWYYVNRLIDANHVQRDLMGGPTTVTWVSMLDDARELRPNEIAVSGTREGKPASGVWRLDGNRMVQLSARFGDQQLVSDGKWVKTGAAMPWITRCDAAQPAGVDVAAAPPSDKTNAPPPATPNPTTAAGAQHFEYKRSVPSGVESMLAHERSWDANCQPLPLLVRITRQPASGSLWVIQGPSTIPEGTPRGGNTGACAGKPMVGNQVMYRSNPGFHGTDAAAYDLAYANGRRQSIDVVIEVTPAPSLAQAAPAPQGKSLACTVASGREDRCTSHMHYDGQRREWPVSITVTVPPANGKVSTKIAAETAKNGLQVHATELDYRSNPGFVGQDSFTYQRRSEDPSDPLNGTYTMIVTVK